MVETAIPYSKDKSTKGPNTQSKAFKHKIKPRKRLRGNLYPYDEGKQYLRSKKQLKDPQKTKKDTCKIPSEGFPRLSFPLRVNLKVPPSNGRISVDFWLIDRREVLTSGKICPVLRSWSAGMAVALQEVPPHLVSAQEHAALPLIPHCHATCPLAC